MTDGNTPEFGDETPAATPTTSLTAKVKTRLAGLTKAQQVGAIVGVLALIGALGKCSGSSTPKAPTDPTAKALATLLATQVAATSTTSTTIPAPIDVTLTTTLNGTKVYATGPLARLREIYPDVLGYYNSSRSEAERLRLALANNAIDAGLAIDPCTIMFAASTDGQRWIGTTAAIVAAAKDRKATILRVSAVYVGCGTTGLPAIAAPALTAAATTIAQA